MCIKRENIKKTYRFFGAINIELGGGGDSATLIGPQEEVEGGAVALRLQDPHAVLVQTVHLTQRRDHQAEGRQLGARIRELLLEQGEGLNRYNE